MQKSDIRQARADLGLKPNCSLYDVVERIFLNDGLSPPHSFKSDLNLQMRFFSKWFACHQKKNGKDRLPWEIALKVMHKASERKSGKANRRDVNKRIKSSDLGLNIHDIEAFKSYRSKKIQETDWGALSLFFGSPQENLKTVSCLPSRKFYTSSEWRAIRYFILKKRGNKCECCGRSVSKHGITIHVDHILPRSKYPDNALNPTNLQVLCEDCNVGKSNGDITDWRD